MRKDEKLERKALVLVYRSGTFLIGSSVGQEIAFHCMQTLEKQVLL